jgi:5-formyltetrahydrofolate cyclo-ligase
VRGLAGPVTYGGPVPPPPESVQEAKTRLRVTLITARRARGTAERETAREAVGEVLAATLRGFGIVAGYLPLPTEPFPVSVLDALVAAGSRVLVPVVTGAAPLDWCWYPSPVRRSSLGIDEPLGRRLGPEAIARVDAVLVPALAVDGAGHRLGRGAGHYDRTLALLAQAVGPGPLPARIAVVYDEEVLDQLPSDALDQRVTGVVTPAGGLRAVG